MTTAQRRPRDERPTGSGDAGTFHRRLLDALADAIEENGYKNTTVGEIVRRARTSRRTFYEHFSDKESCFVALLNERNEETIRRIAAAVDPQAPWQTQIRQAVDAWIRRMESSPPVMLSWIREMPALGGQARRLQRDNMEAFITLIQTLCDTAEMRAAGVGPVPRQRAIMLLGGLRELVATTVEDGGRPGDLSAEAVDAAVALLTPQPS
ncbi:MAG TPA: TetR/AcrR family transcriptional regulator [Streptosporangiaceae bacterium]|jgi:AcrR family transcriptional regulator